MLNTIIYFTTIFTPNEGERTIFILNGTTIFISVEGERFSNLITITHHQSYIGLLVGHY